MRSATAVISALALFAIGPAKADGLVEIEGRTIQLADGFEIVTPCEAKYRYGPASMVGSSYSCLLGQGKSKVELMDEFERLVSAARFAFTDVTNVYRAEYMDHEDGCQSTLLGQAAQPEWIALGEKGYSWMPKGTWLIRFSVQPSDLEACGQ